MKYAFIDERIKPSDLDNINYEDLIVKSLEIKRDIVERDEKESGDRMLLNFGHTIGHAIEKLYNYKLSHGECVVKGMAYAVEISNKLGYLSDSDTATCLNFIKSTAVSLDKEFTKEEILSVVKSDKKAYGNYVNFVLTKGFANSFIEKIDLSKLSECL